jgi:hypothetical protein
MKNIDMKALRIVIDGLCDIDTYTVEPRGTFRASGTVQGEHGIYEVRLTGDRPSCECTYGTECPGVTCSHARALELAVWLEATRETERV